MSTKARTRVPRGRTPERITDERMKRVAGRLREARESLGISLRQFSDYLDDRSYPVDWTTIQRWELGKMRIPADYVLMLSDVAGASPTWILTGEGQPPRERPKDW